MRDDSARAIACRVVHATESSNEFADERLAAELGKASLSDVDKNLTTAIVYGTLARRLSIDHQLRPHIKRGLDKVESFILTVLRVSAFQILYLDRVPAYAVVNAGVELAKHGHPKAAGFVNAVLRRLANGEPAPPPQESEEDRLAVEYSHPRWIVRMWMAELGEAAATALMSADNQANPTVLRVLGRRDETLASLAERGCEATACTLAPDAIKVRVPDRCEGLAVSQSEASQLVCLLVAPNKGDRVLDACAAPGGKSAYLARLAGEQGRVFAVDPSQTARQRIKNRLTAAGAAGVTIEQCRLQEFESDDSFDRVLVDAPCSGLGTLRQHPEIRWRRSPTDLQSLARTQLDLLRAASRFVRSSGRLVYSTCTITRAENEEVIDAFLSSNPDFQEDADSPLSPSLEGLVDDRGRFRTFPHEHDTDGFFAARLRRR